MPTTFRAVALERYVDSPAAAEGGQATTFAFPTFRFAHNALIDTNNHARLSQIFGIDIMRYQTEVLRSFGKARLSREVCYGP